MLMITYFLAVIFTSIIVALAGMCLMDIFVFILKSLAKSSSPSIDFLEKLGSGYAFIIYFILLSLLPVKYGIYGLNFAINALGKVVLILALAKICLLAKGMKLSRLRSISKANYEILICISCILFISSYLNAVQSVDTQWDPVFYDFKAIGWSMYEDTLSDPTLSLFYSQIDPAVFLFPLVDSIFGIRELFFSLPILATISFALLTYAFAKRAFGMKCALSSFILFFASPLLFLYLHTNLYRDLEVYYLVFSCFYGVLRLSSCETQIDEYFWSFFLGVTTTAALLAETKGVVVLLLIPSLMAYFSRRRMFMIFWSIFSGVGLMFLKWILPLATEVGEIIKYLDIPLLLTITYIAGLLVIYRMGRERQSQHPNPFAKISSITRRYGLFFVALTPTFFWRLELLFRPISDIQNTPLILSIHELVYHGIASHLSSIDFIYHTYGNNIQNVFYLIAGAYTFPSFIAALTVIGSFVLTYLFVTKSENKENIGAFLICFWIQMFFWIFFFRVDVGKANWRYLIFTIPFCSIASAKALSYLFNEKVLPYFTLLLTSVYICVVMNPAFDLFRAEEFFPQSFWPAQSDFRSWMQVKFIILEIFALLLIGVVWGRNWKNLRRKLKISKIRFTIAGRHTNYLRKILFIFTFCSILSYPFLNIISSTIFSDAYEAKNFRHKAAWWGYGLTEPFDYISSHRSDFDGKFLTLMGIGIEYYTGMMSTEFSIPEITINFWRYLNDTNEMRQYLRTNNIKYVLLPLPDNKWGLGETVRVILKRTVLTEILCNSTIIETWPTSGWILFDISCTDRELQNPILELDMDEGQGTTVHDTSGLYNHGTVYGASWVKGARYGGLSFDSMDDYVKVPYSPSLNITEEVSIELWVNVLNDYVPNGGEWTTLVGKKCPTFFGIFLTTHLQPRFTIRINELRAHSEATEVVLGEWYHIVGTYDGNALRLYLNGVEKATAFGSTSLVNSTDSFYMGPIDGSMIIDKVRVYNRTLSTIDSFFRFVQFTRSHED